LGCAWDKAGQIIHFIGPIVFLAVLDFSKSSI